MNGKGSKPRPTDLKKYGKHFSEINWKSKPPIMAIKIDDRTKMEYHYDSCAGEHDVVVEAIESAALHQN